MDGAIARRLLAGGLAIGLLADVALDGPALGLNVPLLVAAILGAGWSFRRRGRAPDPLDAWLPLVAIVLAAFVAVRGDPFLALLDAMGSAAFTGASLVAFSGLPVTRRSASVVATMAAMDARGGRRRARPRAIGAGRPRRTAGRCASRRRRGRSRSARAPACRPDRRDLRDPVRLGRPDLRARLADLLGWQIDLGSCPGGCCSSCRVRGSPPGCCRWRRSGSRRSSGRRSARRPRTGVGRCRPAARGHRGAGRPGRHRSRGRRLRRPPDRLPVRWARHARGRRA